MDASSEAIHAVLPLFVTTTLGGATIWVGFIDGVGRGLALVTRGLSGTLSDRGERRKPWLLAGYGLAALSKPLFGLAPNVGVVVLARFTDRIGKGLRGAPRDAMIADATPPDRWGAALGLRRTMDLCGAVVGPLLAIGLLAAGLPLRALLLWAALPAMLAIGVLAVFVHEPVHVSADGAARSTREHSHHGFAWVVAASVAIALARISIAFVILRAADLGWSPVWVPALPLTATLAQAATSYVAGRSVDRRGAARLLVIGCVFLIGSHLTLAGATVGPAGLLAAALAWGLHGALTDAPLSTLVARTAPARQRGARFGIHGVAMGLATLSSAVAAGALWDTLGPELLFRAAAGVALLALPLSFVAARVAGR